MALKDWSTTPSSNAAILTGLTLDGAVLNVPLIDDCFREMAAQLASQIGKTGYKMPTAKASAATCDLSTASGWFVDISGTVTITSFGVVPAGQLFILRFLGAMVLTHNSSTLALPGNASITTATNDVALMISQGAGAWRCICYQRVSGNSLAATSAVMTVGPPTADTGFRISRSITDGYVQVDGGTNPGTGAYMTLYGETHSTNARDIILGTESAYRYFYDWSAATHYWRNNTNAVPMSLNAAGDLTITGQVNVDSIIQSTDATMIIASTSGGSIEFRPNGAGSLVERVTINTQGTVTIDPSAGPAIYANKPTSATATIRSFGSAGGAGLLGYCANTAYYGYVAYQTSGGVAYSYYGVGQTFNSTSWDVSDARAKSEITDCDCHDAYAKVRAIGVKAYRKAGMQRTGEQLAADEIGWLAQDIELVIPEAVMDVEIPQDDTATRAMVGGDTIKATNDRSMLATLWAAFQHQAEIIQEMQTRIETLEASQP